jgi:cytidylate kinase
MPCVVPWPYATANPWRDDLQTENTNLAIAIDGPAASGKSTIGHMLAKRLGFLLLDTGCMYRALTWAVLELGLDPADEAAVTALARAINLDIAPADGYDDGRFYTVLLDENDITWQIRSAPVDVNVSQISAYQNVRKELVKRQRAIAARGDTVVVGRDIGTVVLPEAPLKLYIVASAEERARRRWRETIDRGGKADFDKILQDIIRRDQFDGQRLHSPMRPAEDAILIDTSGRTPKEILAAILALPYFKERKFAGQ